MLANESSNWQRDHKQVRNMAHAVTAVSGQCRKWGNVADNVQSVRSSMQTHPIVKEVGVKQRMSLMIMCYTEEQMAELKHFLHQ